MTALFSRFAAAFNRELRPSVEEPLGFNVTNITLTLGFARAAEVLLATLSLTPGDGGQVLGRPEVLEVFTGSAAQGTGQVNLTAVGIAWCMFQC